MSNYNPVYKKIWSGNRFNKLSMNSKFIFLYLLTNERVTQTGIYTIAPKHIVCDTELNIQKVKECIEELEANKLIKFWHDDNLIFILDNFKFARNTIRNASVLSKTIQGQRDLYHNEELWELFDTTHHVILEEINQSLMKQQSNKCINNNINSNHNRINKEGV